ncbi:MAG TPA: low affinity iron permease family protein [Polyangiales bacterium]|nr:low affinity iron permease family protein [Polyangiales bacterium]
MPAGKPRSAKRDRASLICELDERNPKLGAILRLTQPELHKRGFFRSMSQKASTAVGRPWAFSVALAIVITWAALGPVFHYSDTWQLVINTGTTIITFLMVFLIQSAQNRDTDALRLKLDALILAIHNVSNTFVDIEDFDDEDLEMLRKKLRRMASQAQRDDSDEKPGPIVKPARSAS